MLSSNVKYIGLDVHKRAISIAVLNDTGKLQMVHPFCSNHGSVKWRRLAGGFNAPSWQ
jgi:hypothetical protein